MEFIARAVRDQDRSAWPHAWPLTPVQRSCSQGTSRSKRWHSASDSLILQSVEPAGRRGWIATKWLTSRWSHDYGDRGLSFVNRFLHCHRDNCLTLIRTPVAWTRGLYNRRTCDMHDTDNLKKIHVRVTLKMYIQAY